MSYDVTIGQDSFNYTWNTAPLFYDHMEGGINSLDGLTGKSAAERISGAFDRIFDTYGRDWQSDVVGNPVFCARYDSPNGWGSTVGGLVFLSRILGACARNPDEIVRVS